MKTPEEWMQACNQAFVFTEGMIEAIQRDALKTNFTSLSDKQEVAIANEAADALKAQVQQLEHNLKAYRQRWLDARRYLREANKGAERNAKSLEAATCRYREMLHNDKRWKEREQTKHETIVWNWLTLSDAELSTKLEGETWLLSADELRACRKLLKALLGTKLRPPHTL